MISKDEFIGQVANAYDHLYDLVYLRTHPLTDLLVADSSLTSKEEAWRLHHLLTKTISELDPGPHAPVQSHEWRRFQLMELHYVDGLGPQAVADQLAISRRTYYRELKTAIESIATILWERHGNASASRDDTAKSTASDTASGQLELLRLEAARISQSGRSACLEDVVEGVLPLLSDMMRQRNLVIDLSVPEAPFDVAVDRILLRQIILEVLSYAVEHTRDAVLHLSSAVEPSGISLSLTVEPPTAFHPGSQMKVLEQIALLEQMGAQSRVQITPITSIEPGAIGFGLRIPTVSKRTVLVTDDNEDVLQLFERYLSANGYQVVTAGTAREAFDLARRIQPLAITLDLMMPQQDGWELMQALLAHPDTNQIPIVVCSVLKKKKLALSVGATVFLEKPVTEKILISAIKALEGDT